MPSLILKYLMWVRKTPHSHTHAHLFWSWPLIYSAHQPWISLFRSFEFLRINNFKQIQLINEALKVYLMFVSATLSFYCNLYLTISWSLWCRRKRRKENSLDVEVEEDDMVEQRKPRLAGNLLLFKDKWCKRISDERKTSNIPAAKLLTSPFWMKI